ncbi:MAG: hypothetical protein ABIO70_03270 [Pseudomonadota bacterium]
MNDPLRDVFVPLEPPPGGLQALRARLHGERTPRLAWAGALAVAAAAAALVLALPRPQPAGRALAEGWACGDAGLAPMLCEARLEPVRVPPAERGRLALVATPSADPGVLIYRMAATNPPLSVEEIGGAATR